MKSNQPIIFILNKTEKIIINLDHSLDRLDCCYNIPIFFQKGSRKYLLTSDSFYENMQILSLLLTKALTNELILDNSINQDIGYLYNEYLQNNAELSYQKLEGIDYWVGLNYKLWTHKKTSWIYNDTHDSIIFEITHIYPGNFEDDSVSYDQWKKKYKFFIKRKIPIKTAKLWLRQANKIIKEIETAH